MASKKLTKDSQATPDKAKEQAFQKKKQTFLVRALWTFVMIGMFVGIFLSGHVYISGLITLLQLLSFNEVINLTGEKNYFDDLPWGRVISWYFMVVAMFYHKGEVLFMFLDNVGILERVLYRLQSLHRLMAYTLYMGGFMFFVCTLRKGYYRQQFTHFSATHLSIFLVVIQGNYIEVNILHGLYWFLVPVSLVIINDIMAYVCGITIGKTPLIGISPKKTVEGFIGAWVFTVIFSFIITYYSISSYYMICPVNRLGVTAFTNYVCEIDPVFLPQKFNIVNLYQFTIAPIYIHAAVLATFASLVAPFGGFFASGTKRAFQVKDFGVTIPGHGGITDRFDCQFVMGFFACIYYDTFVHIPGTPDLKKTLNAISALSNSDQAKLAHLLNPHSSS